MFILSDLKKTRVYQDVFQEGEQEVALHLLSSEMEIN